MKQGGRAMCKHAEKNGYEIGKGYEKDYCELRHWSDSKGNDQTTPYMILNL